MPSDREILTSLLKRRQQTDISGIRDLAFSQQDDFVMDMGRLVGAQTTVRAGKSSGLAIKYFRAGQKYKNVMMPYIALTRDSARNIMWPVLHLMADKFKIDCEFTESNLTCYMKSTGSSIKLFGADMRNFILRLKGIKTPLAAVDEAQEFRSHLGELVDDILIARTSEYDDGQVAVTGTPGAMPKGYFFDVSNGGNGFNIHKWSLFQNPYFPTARQFVEQLKIKKGWQDDHPTLLREYYGKWVYDAGALVYHYDKDKNHYDDFNLQNPIYIMGIDFGFEDADSISILAWDEKSPITYLVEETVVKKQGLTELVAQVEHYRTKYSISKIVSDFGGLGKKLSEEMSRRYQIPMVAAEKSEKAAAIELFNDALRTGRFKAKSTSRFAQDSMLLEWDKDKSTPDRKVISNRFHSDALDSALYAFRESPAYSYQAEPIQYKRGTPEWAKQETDDMEEKAFEHFKSLEDSRNEW